MYAAIVFLPLIAAIIAGLFGRFLGDRGSQVITCGAVITAAVLSIVAFFKVVIGHQPTTVMLFDWIVAGDLQIAWALRIDQLKGQRALVGLRGPGQLTVGAIAADRLQVAMIGNGTMTLGGAAKTARMTLSGAGAVDAGALEVGELISDSEGAGDHILHAVKSAAVTARGIGKVVVLGRPVCTVRNVGSGSVTCGAGK